MNSPEGELQRRGAEHTRGGGAPNLGRGQQARRRVEVADGHDAEARSGGPLVQARVALLAAPRLRHRRLGGLLRLIRSQRAFLRPLEHAAEAAGRFGGAL